MSRSGTLRVIPGKPGDVSLNCGLSAPHLFYLHLQIQQMQIQHQPQIIVQLQTALEILLRFVGLALSLVSKPPFGINEGVAVVERDALVKVGDREFGITLD